MQQQLYQLNRHDVQTLKEGDKVFISVRQELVEAIIELITVDADMICSIMCNTLIGELREIKFHINTPEAPIWRNKANSTWRQVH
jgi:hypothetical protein